MDLVEVVERARGGDVDAFTALVERYQRLAHGSAVAVLHNVDIARDVVQESFVAAWHGLPRLIDPKAWITSAVVGERHADVAERVRRCLAESGGLDARPDLDATDRATVARARRLRQFFSQPFFIAEPYTNLPGSFVPRADTVAACAAILDGTYDDVPEEAFRFTGGIEEVLARARATE